MSILAQSPLLKYSVYSIPFALSGACYYFYEDRKSKLDNPITERAIKIDAKEGIITYNFKVKGASGKLNTTITADYAAHSSLKIFNEELEEHSAKKAANDPNYDVRDFEDNWPIDLEEYDLPDTELYNIMKDESKRHDHSKKEISNEEKIWRIKSLRVSVDDDTRILLLPLPESKRSKRLIETRYTFQTYQDIIRKYERKQEELESAVDGEYKRFEDKTPEEVLEDIKHRRRKQFQQMNKIRKYQFMFFTGAFVFYFLVWRRFRPKPVLDSLVYHQAIEILKKSKNVEDKIGNYFQVMNCTGKIYPFFSKVSFDITLDGCKDQAKFRFKSEYKEKLGIWMIDEAYMLTKSDLKTVRMF